MYLLYWLISYYSIISVIALRLLSTFKCYYTLHTVLHLKMVYFHFLPPRLFYFICCNSFILLLLLFKQSILFKEIQFCLILYIYQCSYHIWLFSLCWMQNVFSHAVIFILSRECPLKFLIIWICSWLILSDFGFQRKSSFQICSWKIF